MNKQLLGKRIREARMNADYTQEQLAEEAEISIVHLSEIERGKKLPSLTLFVKLAELLRVPTDSLLRDELDSGKTIINNDVTRMLDKLTPKQRRGAVELLETYIRNL